MKCTHPRRGTADRGQRGEAARAIAALIPRRPINRSPTSRVQIKPTQSDHAHTEHRPWHDPPDLCRGLLSNRPPPLPAALVRRGIGRLLHCVRQRRTEARPCLFRGETGTDTLVILALVRRRFGIAGIITINPLLPHLHKGAGS